MFFFHYLSLKEVGLNDLLFALEVSWSLELARSKVLLWLCYRLEMLAELLSLWKLESVAYDLGFDFSEPPFAWILAGAAAGPALESSSNASEYSDSGAAFSILACFISSSF